MPGPFATVESGEHCQLWLSRSKSTTHGCVRGARYRPVLSDTARTVSGPDFRSVSGNVLLRTAQYRLADTKDDALPIAKMFLTGKIFNGRWSLERTLRDHALRVDVERLKGVIGQMKQALADLMSAGSVEELMGIEGVAAKAYFSVFDQMILKNPAYFCFGRQEPPPADGPRECTPLLHIQYPGP